MSCPRLLGVTVISIQQLQLITLNEANPSCRRHLLYNAAKWVELKKLITTDNSCFDNLLKRSLRHCYIYVFDFSVELK